MWRSPHSSASSGIVLGLDRLASLSGDPVALSRSEHGFKFVHIAGGILIVQESVRDPLTSVEDGCMVAPSEGLSDVLE